jgi:CBS domain-containing membrane protein
MNLSLRRLAELGGIEPGRGGHIEKIVSAVGGFAGIFGVAWVSWYFVGPQAAMLVVASMGASAVLLFAVPHGPLSQPWALIGGHLVSAIIGVSCVKFLGTGFFSAAMAVALAIGTMHYLRCIHPPGGATALTAVLAGGVTHRLGYMYVLTPVMLNTMIIFIVALAVNAFFPWRRYPAALVRWRQTSSVEGGQEGVVPEVSHEDFVYAMSQMDSFIDVSESDLAHIYELARIHASGQPMRPEQIRLGSFYTNGSFGPHWSVRQVLDESPSSDPDKDSVIYRTVAGENRRHAGTCTRREFAAWARHEVQRDETTWRRIPD